MSRTRLAVILLLAALLGGGHVARAESGKKKKEAGAAAVSGTAASPTPARFNPPIPVGHVALGLRIPYFDIHGKLQMYFIIARALRSDLDHLEMKNAYMQTFDEKENPDATVFMSRSVLDLNTMIVASDIPVTVRRSDFEIVGQKMAFNTRTRSGHMFGHVRMIIYNHQEMAAAIPSPTPSGRSPAPRPAASP